MEPEILFEDNHLLAVNKPAGWLVQGDQTGDRTLTDWAKDYIAQKYEKPGAVFLHPVHRIDRPVSGAVLFARTSKALTRLTALFRERKVEKTYWAIVLQRPMLTMGELRHYLLKDSQKNTVQAFNKPFRDAKEAVLRYEVFRPVSAENPNTVLLVEPLTGRPHQIRVQLAEIGCTILGDLKYGAKEALPDGSIGLHCRQMALIHPIRLEPLVVRAPAPGKPWWNWVAGFDHA